MAGSRNAYMVAPDPQWGTKVFGPEERHLAKFDKWRDGALRLHRRILGIGLGLVAASLVTTFARLGLPLAAITIPGALGFLLVAGGLWVPWRLSFACHRMWGVYDAGFVAPFYPKGGWEPLVRWSDVQLLRLRRMRAFDAKTKTEGEQFLIRALDRHRMNHRFWESELTQMYGFSPEEARLFKEGFIAAARARLPAAKVVVEEDVSADGSP